MSLQNDVSNKEVLSIVFRDLTADEIETRVAKANEKGVTFLLYKNARCDMNILDETVGVDRWQRKHYECKGNLFCSVGIKFDEWIWKDDCGTESYSEKEKGEASDSFKRACFNWGIGRELYTAPFIFVKWGDVTKTTDKKGNNTTFDKLIVSQIVIKDKKIIKLEIYNLTLNKVVFKWALKNQATDKKETTNKFMTTAHINTVKKYCAEFNTNTDKICEKYKIKDLSEMTYEQFKECTENFEKAKK